MVGHSRHTAFRACCGSVLRCSTGARVIFARNGFPSYINTILPELAGLGLPRTPIRGCAGSRTAHEWPLGTDEKAGESNVGICSSGHSEMMTPVPSNFSRIGSVRSGCTFQSRRLSANWQSSLSASFSIIHAGFGHWARGGPDDQAQSCCMGRCPGS